MQNGLNFLSSEFVLLITDSLELLFYWKWTLNRFKCSTTHRWLFGLISPQMWTPLNGSALLFIGWLFSNKLFYAIELRLCTFASALHLETFSMRLLVFNLLPKWFWFRGWKCSPSVKSQSHGKVQMEPFQIIWAATKNQTQAKSSTLILYFLYLCFVGFIRQCWAYWII